MMSFIFTVTNGCLYVVCVWEMTGPGSVVKILNIINYFVYTNFDCINKSCPKGRAGIPRQSSASRIYWCSFSLGMDTQAGSGRRDATVCMHVCVYCVRMCECERRRRCRAKRRNQLISLLLSYAPRPIRTAIVSCCQPVLYTRAFKKAKEKR